MAKYICIHGHFYQPPRENAWLEEIEIQESAAPYHNWNERITAECYGPNANSRILNDNQKIVDIVNNYARMSFNMGPTLLSWMEAKAPKVYQSIIEGDYLSRKLFGGHGSAMAQTYNHIIMPLANRRDKETQIIWGLKDFKNRFGRKAAGMWLGETAVDTETLELLALHEVKFTVLAPSQAKHYRKIGQSEWIEGIDSQRPYICKLPSGKSIYLFFYDGEVSQSVAFKSLLNDGKKFAHYLIDAFRHDEDENPIVHIATDGETYGHHHRNGDMALAYCTRYIEENKHARITNYAEYLSLVEVNYEVEIHENSSWSCAHGIERWRSNCGCQTGGEDWFQQEWRTPLRDALDFLRDKLIDIYQDEMKLFHQDPWQLRNLYFDAFFHRSPEKVERFLDQHIGSHLKADQKTRIIRLLEMQRNALLMYTSCGWFFNDISGIETIQIIQYANRAIQLAEGELNIHLEKPFVDRLKKAVSNHPEYGNGEKIYHEHVAPKRLSLTQVGMHYAVSSLFNDDQNKITVLNYDCKSDIFERYRAGNQILLMGMTNVTSRVTLSSKYFSFVVLYLGNHHIVGNTSDLLTRDLFLAIAEKLKKHFYSGNISEVSDLIRENFFSRSFSFFDLFKDEQLKLINFILERNKQNAMAAFDQIYDQNYSLLNVMKSNNLAIPEILKRNLESVILYKLGSNFYDTDAEFVRVNRLKHYINEMERWQIQPNTEKLSFYINRKINVLVNSFYEQTDKNGLLQNISSFLKEIERLNVGLELNELQNLVYKLARFQTSLVDSNILRLLATQINFDPDSLSVGKEIGKVKE